jgi:subtilisin family serine protease
MNRFTSSWLAVLALSFGGPLIGWAGSAPTEGPEALSLPDRIAPHVLAATAAGSSAPVLVVLSERADLSSLPVAESMSARRHQVRDALWTTAQSSQHQLRAWLDDRGISYRPFYIVNAILVDSADRVLVEALAGRPEVARVAANPRVRQDLPEAVASPTEGAGEAIEWNVTQIRAPELWALGIRGEGVVVGTQDTGFDWDHPALIRQYRGWSGATANHDYNWHDSIHSGGGSCGPDSPEPCDDHGHGTLTTGVVVGDDLGGNQIGVAPGARWIGCRNMDEGFGTPATYLECLEFFLAPYPVGGTPAQGDPDRAPHVTNNSWTCPPSEGCDWDTLQAAFEAQRAAGIMTVVAAGNTGSSCSSVEVPPAIYDSVYSIGSTNLFDEISSFSSRGPVLVDGSGRLKPDISAPGEDVRSSAAGGGYQSASGTSLASPHVAGAVALLWSASPSLIGRIEATETIFNSTAEGWTSDQCGDPADAVPNNVYGWGILDALSAYHVFSDSFESGNTYFWSSSVP